MKVPGKVVAWATAGAVAIATPFIAGWEGKRNDPYRDIVGVWTVCYGETRVNMRRYSDAECMEMLHEAVKGYAEPVARLSPGIEKSPKIWASHTSLSYNIGLGSYAKSSVRRLFAAKRYVESCKAIGRYVYAGGKIVKGLVRRRQDEVSLCLSGVKDL